MAEENRERSHGPSEARFYLPAHEGWTAAIKQDWSKEYCFMQMPGEDHFHLLLCGEIYLQRGTERYCLNCALRHGYATRERTFWQKESGTYVDETEERVPSN